MRIIRLRSLSCSAVSYFFPSLKTFVYMYIYIYICPSWCEFLLLLRPCVIVIVYRQFEMFDRIDTYLIVWNVRMYVNRETEKEKRRLKKLILSFRVSRCQRVMFYLKENNLRYWSLGVFLSCSLPLVWECAFKWSNTCQHNFISLPFSLYGCFSKECSNEILSCTVDFSLLLILLLRIVYWIEKEQRRKTDFIIIYSSLAQMSFYRFLFILLTKGREICEKAYFFLFSLEAMCKSSSFWLKVKVV